MASIFFLEHNCQHNTSAEQSKLNLPLNFGQNFTTGTFFAYTINSATLNVYIEWEELVIEPSVSELKR